MDCLYVDRDAPGTARVSDAVVARMRDMAAGRLPHARPLLLFPEGTTTNGRYLLPFKTGAFLAGLPLRPVVLRYADVRGRWEGAGSRGAALGGRAGAGGRARRRPGQLLLSPQSPSPASPRPAPPAGPLLACVGDDPGGAAHVPAHGQPGAQRDVL